MLASVLLGMVAGSRSLREVERLTDELTPPIRAKLGIPRRVLDTTLRDALSSLEPDDVRPALHAATRAAQRRKALEPDGLPFGVVSLDGKATSVPAADDFFAQRQTAPAEARLLGLVRTVTATLTSSTARPVIDVVPIPAGTNEMGMFQHCLCALLTSSTARPVIDVVPIPAGTNEMGMFQHCLCALMRTYGRSDLFRLVTYDAGACSKENARAVRALGLLPP